MIKFEANEISLSELSSKNSKINITINQKSFNKFFKNQISTPLCKSRQGKDGKYSISNIFMLKVYFVWL